MRASRRRSHHSFGFGASLDPVNLPRSIAPLASMPQAELYRFRWPRCRACSPSCRRGRAEMLHPAGDQGQNASSRRGSRQFRICDRDFELRVRENLANDLARSAATQIGVPFSRGASWRGLARRVEELARRFIREPIESLNWSPAMQSRCAAIVQFVGVANVGPASSRTWAIAAGSSLPTSSSTDSGSMRRISTARARRSSRGASSRYA